MVTNKNYNVDFAKLSDKNSIFDFPKELSFDDKASSIKNTRDKSLIRLLISAAIMDFWDFTNFLPENSRSLCDTLKILVQEKQAGNNSDTIDGENVAISDKLLEYICISTKRHKNLLPKCAN